MVTRDGEKQNKNIRNDIEGCQETLKTMPNVLGKGKSKPSFKHKRIMINCFYKLPRVGTPRTLKISSIFTTLFHTPNELCLGVLMAPFVVLCNV